MSKETTTMPDVLKGAQNVTSLDSTDRVLAFDTNGNLKSLTRESMMSQHLRASMDEDAPASGRWLRILEVSSMSNGFVWISNRWSNKPPRPLCFMYLGAHRQNINYARVLVFEPSPYFTKLRMVSPSSDHYYLEVFVVSFSKTNDIDLTVSGNLTVPDSFVAGEIPSESVVQEFDLTQTIFGGGVTRYSTISYVLDSQKGRKGGRHEHGDCPIFRQGYQGFRTDDYDSPRYGRRCRYDKDYGSMGDRVFDRQYPGWFQQRYPGGNQPKRRGNLSARYSMAGLEGRYKDRRRNVLVCLADIRDDFHLYTNVAFGKEVAA